MAASNRPDTVDPAILRRLPCKIEIGLPTTVQREDILKVILRSENVSRDVNFATLALDTEGFSGDDLREMCKQAAMLALTETDNQTEQTLVDETEDNSFEMQTITMSHLEEACGKVCPTAQYAQAFI
jgi:SpoVK/Ycf46/Vps4 family AAA+-type ATPase